MTMPWKKFVFVGIFLTGIQLGYTHITCKFEQNLCDWTSENPKFQWRRRSGPTDDATSGPQGDHTTSNGYYTYVRSSDSPSNTTEAILQSKSIQLDHQLVFSFWYYMNGEGIGWLTLNYHSSVGLDDVLWQKVGRQGDSWKLARIKLPPGVFKLQFKAACQLKYGGDIAIDDIVLPSEFIEMPTRNPIYTIRLQDSCSFEHGMCGWVSKNNSGRMWQLQSGGNAQSPISHAHVGKTYCYTRGGHETTLTSQLLKFTGSVKVQFSYILPSCSNSCKLSLSLLERASTNMSLDIDIWHTQQSSAAWQTVTVDTHLEDYYQLQFKFTNGTSATVVGIDDIEIIGAPENPTHSNDSLFSCSFENSFCGIKEDPSSKLDPDLLWKRSKQYGLHGHYLYYQERNCSNGEKVAAVLPQIITDDQLLACLSFRYITEAEAVLQLLQKYGALSGRYVWTDISSAEGSWTDVSLTIDIFNISSFSFEASCNHLVKWTAIDDVNIVKGACNGNKHGGREYSCSFDRNMCGFISNSSNGFSKWTRENLEWSTFDHTTGSGEYMALQSASTMTRKQAQLISPVFNPSSSPQCILFSVQIYGKIKQQIAVFIKAPNSSLPSFPIWRLSKNVKQWHQAEIPLNMLNLTQYQVIIEGTEFGCCDGLITVDDFKIANSACKVKPFCNATVCHNGGTCIESLNSFECVCPPGTSGLTCERTESQTGNVVFRCDFETDMCHLKQDPSTESDSGLMWIRTHGYPHSHGFYAAYYDDNASKGGQAVITTPYLSKIATNLCLSFRYISRNADLLRVAKKEGIPTNKYIWQGADTNGTWKEIFISIIEMQALSLSFEALSTGFKQFGFDQFVAIDDILLQNGTCLGGSNMIDGFQCSFDRSMCGFTQNMNNGYTNWTLGRGSNGPSRDHTTGSGQYLYLQSSVSVEEKKAQLISPIFPASVQPTCILFSVQVFETSFAELNVYVLPVNISEVPSSWRLSRDTSGWHQAEIGVYQPNSNYQVIIEGKEHGCCSGVIAIDDFEMSSDACREIFFCVAAACQNGGTCVESLNSDIECLCLPKYTGIYCQHKIVEKESDVLYHCDFESGINNCNFVQEPSIKSEKLLMWNQSSSLFPSDHGYFAIFIGTPKLSGNKAVLTSPELHKSMNDACLSFRYVSEEPYSLQVLIKDGPSSAKKIWQAYKTEFWNEAYLNLKGHSNFKISFAALCNDSNQVAIDDVILFNASCGSKQTGRLNFLCSFDSGLCGFQEYSAAGYSKWSVGNSSHGPTQDHTSGDGQYLFLQTGKTSVTKKARLISPVIHQNGQPDCIVFSLQMFGSTSSVISVFIMYSNGSSPVFPVWRLSQNKGSTWHTAEITVHQSQDYKIIIDVEELGCCDGVIALDDFKLTTNVCKGTKFCTAFICLNGGKCIESLDTFSCLCPILFTGKKCETAISQTTATTISSTPPGNKSVLFYCNFEHGMCGLTQDPSMKSDPELIWTIVDGGGNYPNTYGLFLSYHQSGGRYGDEARVFTRSLDTGGSDACLSFRYIANNADILRVQLQQGTAQAITVWNSSITHNTWKHAYVGIKGKDAFELTFIAVHILKAREVAIDEVKIEKGICTNKEVTDHSLTCTFDHGMCGFEEIDTEEFTSWSIGVGSSGPATDHTDGSGQYFYIQTNKTKQTKRAKLEWDQLQPRNSTQCLLLSLQLFGNGHGMLGIKIQPSGGAASEFPSWMLQTDSGRIWHQAELRIKETSYYKVVIIAEQSCCDGVIAIDDFEIRPSDCKNPPQCLSSPCLNKGKCVESLNTYYCICNGHFTGSRCQNDMSVCKSTTCLNGGTCIHDLDRFMCLCQYGYTGARCEIVVTTSASTQSTKLTSKVSSTHKTPHTTKSTPSTTAKRKTTSVQSTEATRIEKITPSKTQPTKRTPKISSTQRTLYPTKSTSSSTSMLPGNNAAHSKGKSKELGLALGLSLSAVTAVAVLFVGVVLYRRRQTRLANQDTEELVPNKKGLPARLFSRVNPVYEHAY